MTLFVTADIPVYTCADSLLEQCWRETVGIGDIVYVITSSDGEWLAQQLDHLPGRIRPVTHILAVEPDLILSPTPITAAALPADHVNLHGRALHAASPQPRQLCVSIDLTGFRPLNLAEARARARHLNPAAAPIPRMSSPFGAFEDATGPRLIQTR